MCVDAIKSQGRGCCIIRIGVIEGVRGGGRRPAASTCSTRRRPKAGCEELQKISEAKGRRGNIKRLRMQFSADEGC